MSEKIVKIKGSTDGLQLSFADGADFPSIEREIRAQLESGSGFFLRGTLVSLPDGALSSAERTELQKLFHAYGLILRTEKAAAAAAQFTGKKRSERPAPVPAAPANTDAQVQEMVVVNRTLRGGQEIRTESSVLVCGNVNPGAQIIAGGSIDIRGTCRGMVHAGAFGNTDAFVIADRLIPTQIRIADLVARAPDHMKPEEKAERASIRNGQIVIEPIER
ncbi:MAG: septum site-determining protein MinC [Selenomonadaceae bacterium]|nr:septum site-determining protein MinC [Selenomonadaceae bacterium]MDY2684724.1 septum site-determining protein MinC [Selenomonadaceae bacterium]